MVDPIDPGRLLPGEPPCVLCEVNLDAWLDSLGKGKHFAPPHPHLHLDGRAPSTGCRPCFEERHHQCDMAGYWCACSHSDCRGNR